jgi:ABC-2 type transport system permease protein
MFALARRILLQMRRDRRTLGLMLLAPLVVLSLMYLVLDTDEQPVRIAVVHVPADYVERLEFFHVETLRLYDAADARTRLRAGEITASVTMRSGRLYVETDGTKPAKANRALAALEGARAEGRADRPDLKTVVDYVYGYEEFSVFDNVGPVLIGFIVFFFVFLVSGIAFLGERTTGTLEKLLSMPIRRREIVCGYLLGFGFFTALQSLIIVFFCVHALRVMCVGSTGLVILVTLCGALMSLTLGLLLSTAAQSEFQMMQFIPIVIIPQVFFSGLFDLSPQLEAVGRFMPMYYIAEALRTVMLKGGGLRDVSAPVLIMLAISLLFALADVRLLKRHRGV